MGRWIDTMLLYHSTFRTNLASIKKYGLGAKQLKNWDISESGVVCFSDNPDVAYSYCETAEDVSDYKYESGIIVLAIEAFNLDKRLIRRDINIKDTTSNCFTYKGIVNPYNLYICTSTRGIVGNLMELKRIPKYE